MSLLTQATAFAMPRTHANLAIWLIEKRGNESVPKKEYVYSCVHCSVA